MGCANIMFFQCVSTLAAGPGPGNLAAPSLLNLRLDVRLEIYVYSRVQISRSPDSRDGQPLVHDHNLNYVHLLNINKQTSNAEIEGCGGEFSALDKTVHSQILELRCVLY